MRDMEVTTAQEKATGNDAQLTTAATAPKKPSPKVKEKNGRTPKRVAKQAKAPSYNFDNCASCYIC